MGSRRGGCEIAHPMRRCNARPVARLATLKPLLYKARSKVGVWLSLVEHRVRDAGVAGSNPATPTIPFPTEFPPPARAPVRLCAHLLRGRGGGRRQRRDDAADQAVGGDGL